MTNKEQMILDAKDEAAREYGFDEYERLLELPCSEHEDVINRAMEIYAEKVNNAKCKVFMPDYNTTSQTICAICGK